MKHNLEVLAEAGYDVAALSNYLDLKDLERRGIVEVWECRSTNCDGRYEAPIAIISISCPKCRKTTKRVWPK